MRFAFDAELLEHLDVMSLEESILREITQTTTFIILILSRTIFGRLFFRRNNIWWFRLTHRLFFVDSCYLLGFLRLGQVVIVIIIWRNPDSNASGLDDVDELGGARVVGEQATAWHTMQTNLGLFLVR